MQIAVVKKLVLSLVSLLFLQISFSQLVIQSFSPKSGPIGSTVIIKGAGFSSTPTDNIIYFGTVRAQVISASSNSLTVVVPASASYEPITVTTGNLTAYSTIPFVVTFPGAQATFPKDLFNTRIDVPIDNSDPDNGFGYYSHFTIVDLDDDGKPDMISSNTFPRTISVIRNKSSIGAISFESHREFSTADEPGRIDHADFDGDGKQDIAVSCGKTVSIFKNTSTGGNISFAPRFDIALLSPAYEDIAINDVDRDGKPDFAVSGHNTQNILVFRNTSSSSNLSFDKPFKIPVSYGYEYLTLKDANGDSYPDLFLSYWGYTSYSLKVAKNESTPGNISFAGLQSLDGVRGAADIDLGDLDGDEKLDIAVPDNQGYNFSVFKNVSSANSINFEGNTDFRVGRFPQRLAIGDIDGDGKPDVAVSDNEHIGFTVSIYKNLSTGAGIDFAPQQDLLGRASDEVAIADIDGDGMPEIEVSGTEYSLICVFTRCPFATITQQPKDSAICITGNAIFSVTTTDTTATYQWQVQNGTGWADLSNNGLYSGVTNSILRLTGIDTSMNGYLYRCVIFSKCMIVNSDSALLKAKYPSPPSLIIKTGDTLICPSTKVIFTAYTQDGGASPVYQWKKNNINVGTNTPVYTDSTITEGDIITCILTSGASCLSINTGASNSITMHVTNQLTPQISITTLSNNICAGTPVIFNAVTINAGTTPSFQWMKNNMPVGTNAGIYKDSSLSNGDSVICILTPDLKCNTGNTKSNSIVINVQPLVTPSINITASKNNICPNDDVVFTSTVLNEGNNAVYNWKKNGIDVGNNILQYTDSLFKEGDTVMCILHSNATGCLTTDVVNSNKLIMHLQNLPGAADLGPDRSICPGSTTTLSTSYTYHSYLWQNGISSPTLNVAVPGTYHISVSDACGSVSSDTIVITQYAVQTSFLPADTTVCNYDHIVISPTQNFNKYLWSNNTTASFIDINTPGTYWLQITDNNQCIGRDSIIVSAKDCMYGVYIPAAFTPNNDGKNDFFKPLVFGSLEQYQFSIYNRFGQLVFHATEPAKGWNGTMQGKKQNTGTFVWVCIYKLQGRPLTKKTGTVLLMH